METNIAILRGYGLFYGHVVKVKLLRVIDEENLVIVEFNQKEFAFDSVHGFENRKVQYSGYQLDINSINIEPLTDLTDYSSYELGKV